MVCLRRRGVSHAVRGAAGTWEGVAFARLNVPILQCASAINSRVRQLVLRLHHMYTTHAHAVGAHHDGAFWGGG